MKRRKLLSATGMATVAPFAGCSSLDFSSEEGIGNDGEGKTERQSRSGK